MKFGKHLKAAVVEGWVYLDYKGLKKLVKELQGLPAFSVDPRRGAAEKQFMCANAIGGFVQRSDAMRKWAFGTMFVTGSEACLPIEISGCWLMRGDTVENLTEANDDALCYTWTKIDHTSAAGRALVEEYWTADVDGFLEGKLVTDGKLFL